MNCKFCNEPISETDKFCSKCGAKNLTTHKSKLTYFNVASIAIMVIMLVLQFLPWINIFGESHSIPYWFTQIYYLRSDLVFFIIIYLLIWLYSCFTIPAIIMLIVKKNKATPVFNLLVSIFAIASALMAEIYTVVATETYFTPVPMLLILCAFANMFFTLKKIGA